MVAIDNLQKGQNVPQWQAQAWHNGEALELSSDTLKGQAYILYFYPKDDTPGCTIETKDFNSLLILFSNAILEHKLHIADCVLVAFEVKIERIMLSNLVLKSTKFQSF